jgi:hypothetical protein
MNTQENINKDPETNPKGLPSIQVKPGWQTSQGQMTAFILLLSTLLATYLGWTWATPELLNNIYQLISLLVVILGLVGVNIPILTNYINSRGKIQSNAIWATTSMNLGKIVNKDSDNYLTTNEAFLNLPINGGKIGGANEGLFGSTDNEFKEFLFKELKEQNERLSRLERGK